LLIRVLTISCHYQNIISNQPLPPPGCCFDPGPVPQYCGATGPGSILHPGGTEFKFEVTFCITCAVYTPID